MIIAYLGFAGSGKTYHMTKTALALIEQGKIVFSRHEIEGAYPLLDEREMLRMRDCHVFFDEWHQDHSAKDWWNMDEVLKHIVTQCRKYNIIIHWSAQHWLYMDSFIRHNTDYAWLHEALMRDPDTGNSKISLHRARKVHGLELELRHKNPKPLAKKWLFIRRRVYESYDSFKPIMLSKAKLSDSDVALIQDPYARPLVHLSPDKSVDRSPYLVGDKDSFDADDEAKDSEECIKREDEAYQLNASIEVVNPLGRTRRKRLSNRKNRRQSADEQPQNVQ